MKWQKWTAALAAFCMTVTMTGVPASAEQASLPAAGKDTGGMMIRRTYLHPTADGLVRVFYDTENLWAETYNDDLELQDRQKLELELPMWGGFYAGADGYYLAQAQENPDEDTTQEVFRIVRYDTDWNRVGAASITSSERFGGQVRTPYDWGNAEMTEQNGKLYYVTAHEGYVDASVGRGHQGFLMITVDEAEMTGGITDCDLWHSFAQQIDSDSNGIYVLEQSEGSGYTMVSEVSAEGKRMNSVPTLHYGGDRSGVWSIPCRATVDALAISDSSVLCLGSSIDQSQYDSFSSDTSYNVYLTVTPRDDFTEEATQIKWLTDYSGDGKRIVRTEIVKAADDRYLVLWEESTNTRELSDPSDPLSGYDLHYLFVDGRGEVISEPASASACLSSCKPVLKNDEILWCASTESLVNFYAVDVQTGEFRKKSYKLSGENITWDYTDGVLTLSGEGELQGSSSSWGQLRDDTTKLVIGEGITAVGDSAFSGFSSLKEIELPDTLTSIGSNAFASCDALEEVHLPDGLTTIGDQAFSFCWDLREVYIPASVTEIGEDVVYLGMYINDQKVSRASFFTTHDSYAAQYAEENHIQVVYTDEPESTEPLEPTLYGDTDLDGEVNIMDVILLNKYLLGTESMEPSAKANADADLSGEIDFTDSLNILKFVVEILPSLPV